MKLLATNELNSSGFRDHFHGDDWYIQIHNLLCVYRETAERVEQGLAPLQIKSWLLTTLSPSKQKHTYHSFMLTPWALFRKVEKNERKCIEETITPKYSPRLLSPALSIQMLREINGIVTQKTAYFHEWVSIETKCKHQVKDEIGRKEVSLCFWNPVGYI